MLPYKYKTGKFIDFEKNLKDYFNKYYDLTTFMELKKFIDDFVVTRGNIIDLNVQDVPLDKLKSHLESLVFYLNMFSALKSKINIGKGDYCLQVDFAWKDLLTNTLYYSTNPNLEYYSVLFNLAITLSLIGRAYSNHNDETKIKEGIKNFQYASWVLDKIKQELPGAINSKETPQDLSLNYLSYCGFISLANAQVLVYNIAVRKNLNCELRAKLAKGAQELFGNALQLATGSLGKYIDEGVRGYIKNRKYYYAAVACVEISTLWKETFDKTGTGIGKQIAYLSLAKESLLQGEKDVKYSSSYINQSEYMSYKDDIVHLVERLSDRNMRIYFDSVPEIHSMPKIEKLIKVSPTPYQIEDQTVAAKLNCLVPREVKTMLFAYKQQMMNYICDRLDHYENDGKIEKFLQDLNLPISIEATSSEIPDALWSKISEIQQKGGQIYLINQMSNLEHKSSEINQKISEIELELFKEESEDNKYRQVYGDKWRRVESKILNVQYKFAIEEFKKNALIANNCDKTLKSTIMDGNKNFEILGSSRVSLQKKIPKANDNSVYKDIPEVKLLREEVDKLQHLKGQCKDVIENIFLKLNEDNIVLQFVKVLQGKITEKAIFEENKSKFDQMFSDLDKITQEISYIKANIYTHNEIFLKSKSQNLKPNQENDEFFLNLERSITEYNQTLNQIDQGLKFYTEFANRLGMLQASIADFVLARDIDKSELIGAIQRGENISIAVGNVDYLDPMTNLITNMNSFNRTNSYKR